MFPAHRQNVETVPKRIFVLLTRQKGSCDVFDTWVGRGVKLGSKSSSGGRADGAGAGNASDSGKDERQARRTQGQKLSRNQNDHLQKQKKQPS